MRDEPTTPAVGARQPQLSTHRGLRQEKVAPYLFISPFYILFSLFFLGPSLFAFVLSLFRWNALSRPRWIGLANYTRLFQDEVFWQASWNTLVYMLASIFWVCPLSLLLALALNAPLVRLKHVWRSLYFSPIVTSTVAITIVFTLLYNQRYGLINAQLQAFGVAPIDWLGNRQWVKLSIIGLITWRWTGYTMIYFLAGLQAIPRELYEAAWIDGANGRQTFRYVTIPMLRPVILFVAIIVLIGSIQIFEEPFILTAGGPANASLSIAQYLYTRGIARLEYGYASAVGLVIFVVIFVLSAIQMRWFELFGDRS